MILGATPVPATPCVPCPLYADYRRLLDLAPALRVDVLGAGEAAPTRAQGWYSAVELAADPTALADALAA